MSLVSGEELISKCDVEDSAQSVESCGDKIFSATTSNFVCSCFVELSNGFSSLSKKANINTSVTKNLNAFYF